MVSQAMRMESPFPMRHNKPDDVFVDCWCVCRGAEGSPTLEWHWSGRAPEICPCVCILTHILYYTSHKNALSVKHIEGDNCHYLMNP